MTPITFTGTTSEVLTFSGLTKIKCDNIPPGGYVEVHEELSDSSGYEQAVGTAGKLVVEWPQTSGLFNLLGNYELVRSSETIKVGYEE